MRSLRRALQLGGLMLAISILATWEFVWILRPPERDCPIETLLLDEVAFPLGTSAGEIMQIEGIGRTFYQPALGIANHTIMRFTASAFAVWEMKGRRQIGSLMIQEGGLETPKELVSLELNANDSLVFCRESRGGTNMCHMFARYEKYFVFYNAHIFPDGDMTAQDVRRSLEAADQKMVACLNSSE